jgi:hypothetical protein
MPQPPLRANPGKTLRLPPPFISQRFLRASASPRWNDAPGISATRKRSRRNASAPSARQPRKDAPLATSLISQRWNDAPESLPPESEAAAMPLPSLRASPGKTLRLPHPHPSAFPPRLRGGTTPPTNLPCPKAKPPQCLCPLCAPTPGRRSVTTFISQRFLRVSAPQRWNEAPTILCPPKGEAVPIPPRDVRSSTPHG